MRPAEERALWDITTPDGGDRRFRAQQFPKLPHKFRAPVAEQYRERFNEAGLAAANEFLLDTVAVTAGNAWRLAASDEELCAWAKERASEFGRLAAKIDDKDAAYLYLAEAAKRCGVEPPRITKPRPYCTVTGALARLADDQWWRRQVRKVHGRKVERAAIGFGMVHARAGLYASDETVGRRKEQRHRNRQMLEACLAVNELGQEYTLAQLADLSVSNPVIRRGELMVRMAGFETVAGRLGHVGEFYTLTCPSRMHARHSKSGGINEAYDGTTPGEAQSYLCEQWAKVRACLARAAIRLYGFRVAEPHHDGTPHWHLLLFMDAAARDVVRAAMRKYALQVDGEEQGAKKHRFQAVAIDKEKGTACGYLAKYVAKNIDAYGVDRVDEDLTGRRDPRECAARVDAWAACWGIRQFQQIGGPPVTVWRECRRLDEQPDGAIENVRYAADNGLWCRFTEAMGGPVASRKAAPVKVLSAAAGKAGRYGEIPKKILGLFDGSGVITPTRVHQWSIRRGANGRAFSGGASTKANGWDDSGVWGALLLHGGGVRSSQGHLLKMQKNSKLRSSHDGAGSLRGQPGESAAGTAVRRLGPRWVAFGAKPLHGDFLALSAARAAPWSSVNNCTVQQNQGHTVGNNGTVVPSGVKYATKGGGKVTAGDSRGKSPPDIGQGGGRRTLN